MKIKCELSVWRSVTSDDMKGTHQEITMRPDPDNPDLEGMDLLVVLSCGEDQEMPPCGTPVEFEIEREDEG